MNIECEIPFHCVLFNVGPLNACDYHLMYHNIYSGCKPERIYFLQKCLPWIQSPFEFGRLLCVECFSNKNIANWTKLSKHKFQTKSHNETQWMWVFGICMWSPRHVSILLQRCRKWNRRSTLIPNVKSIWNATRMKKKTAHTPNEIDYTRLHTRSIC